MLTISARSMSAVSAVPAHQLAPRIDAWMAETFRGWPERAAGERRALIHRAIDRALDWGMEVENDYAMFAFLEAELGASADRFFASTRVAVLRDREDLNAQSKVFTLFEMLDTAAPGARS